eukprot:scaffold97399_cov35-Attheya_sp.AAC.4
MRDGTRMENVRDWEAAMSDGSIDDDESRSSGDDEERNMDWELNSTGADGRHYVYLPTPFVEVPTISSRMLEYYEQLFESSYDFMAFYQEEHFAWMERIKSNLPGRNLLSTMPIWMLRENRLPPVIGRLGHIQYQHPNEPLEHQRRQGVYSFHVVHEQRGEHYDAYPVGVRGHVLMGSL